ncbi:MAG: hypothetical protein AAGK38_02325 [Pseudomonadota bacterium]
MKKPSTSDNKKPTGSQSTARPRHSKSAKDPVTIDLPAEDVKQKATRSAVPAARRSEQAVKAEAKPDQKSAATTKDSVAKGGPAKESAAKPNAAKPADKANAEAATAKTTPTDKGKTNKTEAAKTTDTKPQTAPKSAKGEPAKPVQTAAKTQTGEGSSGGGKLVAGIVGGIIALGGAGAAQYLGVLGAPGNTPPETVASVSPQQLNETRTSLQEQIAALEARLAKQAADGAAQTSTAPGVDMDALTNRIDTRVDEQVGAAIAAMPTPSGGGEDSSAALEQLRQADEQAAATLADVQAKLTTTQQAVSDLQGAVNGGEAGETAALSAMDSQLKQTTETLTGLSARVETLEQADPGAAANEELTASLARLNEQLSAVQTQVETAQSNLTTLQEQQIAPLQETVTQKTDALSQQVTEATGRLEGLQEETQKISALSIRLNELASQVTGVADEVTAQNEKVAALQEATTTRRRADQQAAQAIAAAALKGDVDQGRPFGETLATLRQVSGDDSLLAQLNPYADKGVPTKAQLIERFAPVRDAMEAAITPQSDGSLTSRLLSSAQSLVKVKPLEPLEGETPAARLSQMEAAVQQGDLADAITLWEGLPDAAKTVSTGWQEDVKARLAANTMVDTAVQSFLLTNASQ